MNDLDLFLKRRSPPPQALAGPAPTPAELETLLTIAARVPDHGKLVPWRFLVFEGEGRMRGGAIIADAFRANEPGAGADRVATEEGRLTRAALVVGVVSAPRPHPKIPEWEQVMSAGAVCTNLILGATAMGFGAVWLTEWYAYDRAVLDAFGLAPQERMAGFIHIGRPTEARPDRPRPDLASIVTRI